MQFDVSLLVPQTIRADKEPRKAAAAKKSQALSAPVSAENMKAEVAKDLSALLYSQVHVHFLLQYLSDFFYFHPTQTTNTNLNFPKMLGQSDARVAGTSLEGMLLTPGGDFMRHTYYLTSPPLLNSALSI